MSRPRVEESRKAWRASNRFLQSLAKRELRVGVLDASIHDETGLTNAQLLAIHEYGAPSQRIPERSVLRSSLAKERAVMVDILTEGVREASSGGTGQRPTITRLLAAAGRVLAKRVRRRFGSAELAPNVVDAGKRGPLLDTGKLRRAIRYKVYDAGAVVAEGGET